MADDASLMQLAGRLRALRADAGLTLRDLSRKVHVSDSSLSRYFTGQALPPWEVVEALADLAGADHVELRQCWESATESRNRSRWSGQSGAPDERSPESESEQPGEAPAASAKGRRLGLLAGAAVLVAAAYLAGWSLHGEHGVVLPAMARAHSSPSQPAPSATSPAPLLSGTLVALINDDSGTDSVPYVIDLANWSMDDRAPVHLWSRRTDPDYRNQLWTAEKVASGNWRFVNLYSGKCLDRDAGGSLFQARCEVDAAQEWSFKNDGEIRSAVDGQCVEIDGHQRLLGAGLRMATCDSGWYQLWHTEPRAIG